jgi:hypothetical protein
MAAILDAASAGEYVERATLVCPWAACSNCAKHIAAAGISRVVRLGTPTPPLDANRRWFNDTALGDEILREARVEVLTLEPGARAVSAREVPEGFPRLDKQTRPWNCKKGVTTCTREAPCSSCRGRRNRQSGMRKQRDARKALEQLTGAEAARFVGQLGNEESWAGLPLRVEVKSGAQVSPIWTRYAAAEAQSENNRALGDVKPFVMVAMGTRTSDGLVVFRLSQFANVVEAVVNL